MQVADPTCKLRQCDRENTTGRKRVAPWRGEAHLSYNRTEEGGSGKQEGDEVAKWRGAGLPSGEEDVNDSSTNWRSWNGASGSQCDH